MALNLFQPLGDQTTSSDGGPALAIAAMALTTVTLLSLMHPHPLVLPLLSLFLVTGGLVAAAIQALRHRHSGLPMLSFLQIPSLVVFFGFAVAMLGDPDPAVQSLQQLR